MITYRASDSKFRERHSKKSGEPLSFSASLTEGLSNPGYEIYLERLPSGRRASAPHWHTDTDETLYVLSGRVKAHEGSQWIELQTGDTLHFQKDSKNYHFVENPFEEEAQFLIVKPKTENTDVVYPSLNISQ